MLLALKLQPTDSKFESSMNYLSSSVDKLKVQKSFQNVKAFRRDNVFALFFTQNNINPVHVSIIILAVAIIFSVGWWLYLMAFLMASLSIFQSKAYLFFKIKRKIKALGYKGYIVEIKEEEFLLNSVNWS